MENKAETVVLQVPQAKVEPDEAGPPVGARLATSASPPGLETSLKEPRFALEKQAVLMVTSSS